MRKPIFDEEDMDFIHGWSATDKEIEKAKIVIEGSKLQVMRRQLELQESTTSDTAGEWWSEGYQTALRELAEEFEIDGDFTNFESDEMLRILVTCGLRAITKDL